MSMSDATDSASTRSTCTPSIVSTPVRVPSRSASRSSGSTTYGRRDARSVTVARYGASAGVCRNVQSPAWTVHSRGYRTETLCSMSLQMRNPVNDGRCCGGGAAHVPCGSISRCIARVYEGAPPDRDSRKHSVFMATGVAVRYRALGTRPKSLAGSAASGQSAARAPRGKRPAGLAITSGGHHAPV